MNWHCKNFPGLVIISGTPCIHPYFGFVARSKLYYITAQYFVVQSSYLDQKLNH
jgi:hypothetical protein